MCHDTEYRVRVLFHAIKPTIELFSLLHFLFFIFIRPFVAKRVIYT